MRKKMNIELLKRLRTRFLRMKHKKHFDMETFAEKTECGTAMCIAGHALDLQGYKVTFPPYEDGGYRVVFRAPSGRRVQPSEAARKELGMGLDEAWILFHDFDIKTPKQAAKRIEKLIAQAEAN
jgi:hypothetical protein